jgi:zinc protease
LFWLLHRMGRLARQCADYRIPDSLPIPAGVHLVLASSAPCRACRQSRLYLRFPLAYAATAATGGQHAAPTLPPGVTQGPSAEGISEYRFANGFKLLLLPDDSKPTVTVNITYLVGSRHENYGETGMAHLLEHLMFKGSPPQSGHSAGVQQARHELQRHHLAGPHYYETFEAGQDNLQWAISMEADRMVNSHRAQGSRQRDDGGAQRV